jgi:ring-1,2-phenylacetyl-CoA epoxidase subunit PaaD
VIGTGLPHRFGAASDSLGEPPADSLADPLAEPLAEQAARPVPGTDPVARAWAVLASVLDPEVPALSICDLGIVRDVVEAPSGALEIVLTPTYSGCPATEAIEQDALQALAAAGLGPATVRLQRTPAWSSDWISEPGRRKLQAYGIAAPGPAAVTTATTVAPLRFTGRRRGGHHPACPRCASGDTECLSAFGSTACKALYRCLACREPFEYFKPI